MGAFLESEKVHQAQFKAGSESFSQGARQQGTYKGHLYPFCLPRERSLENLYPPIREAAREYFGRHEIKWHDGRDNAPSNHLCDSQVCCVNFLYPLSAHPQSIKALLAPLFPSFDEALPIEDGSYVAFEWIGACNYLAEKLSRNGKRTRGANFTSADAAVLFRALDGTRQCILIEWKYTESYHSTDLRFAKSGTDRLGIYRHVLDQVDSPIIGQIPGGHPALFFEPFYQLMRQQLLAHEMEKARELGATMVTLLHISPEHNVDFAHVTSPSLRDLGTKPTEIWPKLLTKPDRFTSVSTERLFGRMAQSSERPIHDWWRYISARYPWVSQ
jgi:hypothetical protein